MIKIIIPKHLPPIERLQQNVVISTRRLLLSTFQFKFFFFFFCIQTEKGNNMKGKTKNMHLLLFVYGPLNVLLLLVFFCFLLSA